MFNKRCLAFVTQIVAGTLVFLCVMCTLEPGRARAQLINDRCEPGETNPTCAVRFAGLVDPNIDKIKQLLGGDVTVASYQINTIGCFLSGFVVATNNKDSSNIISIQAVVSASRVNGILFKRTLSPTGQPDGPPMLQSGECSARNECTAPPAVPWIYIETQRCGGMHTIYTEAVAGAFETQVQARPISVSWSSVPEEFGFPGIISDLPPGVSCSGDANGDFYARARACNACGCSAWSSQTRFYYFRGECV